MRREKLVDKENTRVHDIKTDFIISILPFDALK